MADKKPAGKKAFFSGDDFKIPSKEVKAVPKKEVIVEPKPEQPKTTATSSIADKYVKRINMAFIPELEDYLRKESIRNGVRITTLVNQMLLECQKHEIIISDEIKVNTTQGTKGAKAKRINIYFSEENFNWITEKSKEFGIQKTELTNQVLLAEKERREN